MKKILILLLFAFNFISLISQTCLPSGITLSSQSDINDFPFNYPGCTEVLGDLIIEENVSGNILNLEGLLGIESISGNLVINKNAALSSLTGFNNLDYIGGGLWLSQNSALQSLAGLSSLDKVDRYVFIRRCNQLSDLNGLNSVDTISESLSIRTLQGITNLTGLSSLEYCESIIIDNCKNIDTIDFCNSLKSTVGVISIYENIKLEKLLGFNSLESSNYFTVRDNPKLNEFGDYPNLINLTRLIIDNNDELVNLSGFTSLSSISDYFIVENNLNLNNFSGLQSLISITNSFEIENNASLVNFAGLAELKTIGENLSINLSPSFVDFQGLDSLSLIGANLVIGTNVSNTNFNGLNNLSVIGGDLKIGNNNIISDFMGLNNLSVIGGNLEIVNNNTISDFMGLSNLTLIEGNLKVANSNISNFVGLSSLHTINSNFFITLNDELLEFNSLNGLNTVLGNFVIGDNDQIETLSGLHNLMQIGGYVDIRFNDNLTSLEGLNNIDPNLLTPTNSGFEILINNNINLSVCAIESICEAIDIPSIDFWVSDNNTFCNSISDFTELCLYNCLSIETNIFTGNIDSQWDNPNNWSLLSVPEECTIVIVPSNKNVIVSNGVTATCVTLDVDTSSIFSVEPNGILNVRLN